MAILNVNSTRMELNKLKNQLTTTRKGHKLLKNKSEGLLREFLNIYRKTLKLRKYIETKIIIANQNLEIAKAKTSKEAVETAISELNQDIKIKTTESNLMGIKLPCFCLKEKPQLKNTISYSFFTNSIYIDKATKIYIEITTKLIELSELEKSLYILSTEIEKIRRKVNAIENILIPDFEQTIKFISLKLEETERNQIARLSRIK